MTVRRAIDVDRAVECRSISAEPVLPEGVAQHDDGEAIGDIFVFPELAAKDGADTEQRKEAGAT